MDIEKPERSKWKEDTMVHNITTCMYGADFAFQGEIGIEFA